MTQEMRVGLRASCWGLISGAVLTTWLPSPAYWVVMAASLMLAVGWLWDSATRPKTRLDWLCEEPTRVWERDDSPVKDLGS